jgi:hypothetical protein
VAGLSPDLGPGVPDEVDAAAAARYRGRSSSPSASSAAVGPRATTAVAQYALCLGFRIRYVPGPQRARGDAAHRAALGP